MLSEMVRYMRDMPTFKKLASSKQNSLYCERRTRQFYLCSIRVFSLDSYYEPLSAHSGYVYRSVPMLKYGYTGAC